MYGRSHIDSAVLQSLQDVMAEDYPALLDAYLADSEERCIPCARPCAVATPKR